MSFVIFSITDISSIIEFIKGMLGIGVEFINKESIYYIKNNLVIIIMCFVGMSPILINTINKIKKGRLSKFLDLCEVVYLLLIFILSVAVIVTSSFNPFIYFRF